MTAPATRGDLRELDRAMVSMGITDRAAKRAWINDNTRGPRIISGSDLASVEARRLTRFIYGTGEYAPGASEPQGVAS